MVHCNLERKNFFVSQIWLLLLGPLVSGQGAGSIERLPIVPWGWDWKTYWRWVYHNHRWTRLWEWQGEMRLQLRVLKRLTCPLPSDWCRWNLNMMKWIHFAHQKLPLLKSFGEWGRFWTKFSEDGGELFGEIPSLGSSPFSFWFFSANVCRRNWKDERA